MSAENWLAKLIEYEVDHHWADAHGIVAAVQSGSETNDPDLLANVVIDDKARIAAFIGVGTGVSQSIPAVGQAIAIGSLLPEALYLAKMQIDITLVVSLLYNKDMSKSDAQATIISCLLIALGADFLKNELRLAAIRVTRDVVEGAIEKIGEQAVLKVLNKMGIEASKKGILKKVPVISIPLNAAMNYGQVHAFGWAAKKLLSPSFVMCGQCGKHTGRNNKFCPGCGTGLS